LIFFSIQNNQGGFMLEQNKSYEADNRTGINHEGTNANKPVQRLTATSIIGDAVENPQGESLGKIDNLMINLNTGQIEYAVIERGGILGVGGKLFAIPFDELRVDEVKEIFILDRDDNYVKESPGFDSSHWPATNDHSYFDSVNAYYDRPPVTPFP
jgi:sporulation protein YlmC with PRC-barrel domain